MADLLAVCETCSRPFTASNFIGGDGATVTITNSRVGPCPYCGGMGRIPDGTYSLVRDTLRLLRGSSTQQLTELVNVLREHREARDLTARVEQASPDLAQALRAPGQSTIDWKFWLPVLLTILTFLLGPAYAKLFEGAETAPADVSQLIEQELRQLVEQQQTPGGTGKVGRNEPCPCGSGTKYKRCHGAPPGYSPPTPGEPQKEE